jgi:ADP-heptose:LPS heptosyltransferase
LVNDCKWQIHEIERNTLLLSELQGFSNKLYQLPKIEITQNSIKKKQFIVAPGASRIGRQWPPEYFAKTSEYIFNRTGWIPIVVGTKDEEGIINKIITTSKDMPWKALHGNILIEDLFVLIANSFFLLCNDSGPMHIGPAVGTTTVAIVPGGEFNAYPLYPISSRYLNIVHVEDTSCFNCRWNCKYNWPKGMPAPCLSNISLQLALSKVESALDQMMTPYVA